MGKQWPSFKIPEHVAYYDPNTLKKLMRRCRRAREIKILDYPHAFPFGLIAQKLGVRLPALIENERYGFKKRCSRLQPGSKSASAS